MTVKQTMPAWVTDNSASKLYTPPSAKTLAGFKSTEQPISQMLNWLFNLAWNWILRFQGAYADYVIGAAADVANNAATHTWATFQTAFPTGPAAGSKVLILETAGALPNSMGWTANNLQIMGEDPNTVVPMAGFTFTLSGNNCYLYLNFSGAVLGSIVISGVGSQATLSGVEFFHVISGAGSLVEIIGSEASISMGGTDGSYGFLNRLIPFPGGNTTYTWTSMTYSPTLGTGSGMYVAIGKSDGTNPVFAYSTDGGKTFTMSATRVGGNVNMYDVVWAGGTINLFVAVGVSDGSNPVICTTPDGNVWTKQINTLGNHPLQSIAFDGTTLVAVGGAGHIDTSTNGTVWADQTVGTQSLYAVVNNGLLFCAVGASTGTAPKILTSAGGVTGWAVPSVSAGGAEDADGLVWSGNQFIAVGNSGMIITSPNGSGTWTAQTSGTSNFLVAVVALSKGITSGTDVLISYSSGNGVFYSLNGGVTWTKSAAGMGSAATFNSEQGRQVVLLNGIVFSCSINIISSSLDGGIPNSAGKSRLLALRMYVQGVWRSVLAVQPELGPEGTNTGTGGVLDQTPFLLMRGPICKRSTTTSPTLSGTPAQIIFDASGVPTFDTNGDWDATNHRYVPKIPGVYKVYVQGYFTSIQSTDTVTLSIRKNAVPTATFEMTNATSVTVSSDTLSTEDLVACNGSTDAIDFTAAGTSGTVLSNITANTFFLIERVA